MKPVLDYLIFTGEANTCALYINGKHVANCNDDCIDADMLYRLAEACETTLNIQEIVCEDTEVNFEDYARAIEPMPKKAQIAYWNSTAYGGDTEGAEKTFVCEVLDKTVTHGQISVDIGQTEGDIGRGLFCFLEIARLSEKEPEDLPSVHISNDGQEQSISVFQRNNELIIRLDNNDLSVQHTRLSDGSNAIVIS